MPAHKRVIYYTLATIATAGLIFQIGHFLEHTVQFGVWLFGDRTAPWMSAPVMELVHMVGAYYFPTADMARQMSAGMEILHLIGNTIFLTTLLSLLYFIRSKWVRYAFYVEMFHLYEHISLTLSIIYLGKPIGFSTLFGASVPLLGSQLAIGYRVFWHFIMNFVPSALFMMGAKEHWAKIKARQSDS